MIDFLFSLFLFFLFVHSLVLYSLYVWLFEEEKKNVRRFFLSEIFHVRVSTYVPTRSGADTASGAPRSIMWSSGCARSNPSQFNPRIIRRRYIHQSWEAMWLCWWPHGRGFREAETASASPAWQSPAGKLGRVQVRLRAKSGASDDSSCETDENPTFKIPA